MKPEELDAVRVVAILGTRGLEQRGRELLAGYVRAGGGLLVGAGRELPHGPHRGDPSHRHRAGPPPPAAAGLSAGCSRLTQDSHAFAVDLLERAGVAITPGIDFGDNAPQQHVRFAYTQSIERLQEGVRRISKFLQG